jgi:transcriptional regulator
MEAAIDMPHIRLSERKNELLEKYEEYRSLGLKLDMSRGKPDKEQLELSMDLFRNIGNLVSEDGTDCRNYGAMDGIIEAKNSLLRSSTCRWIRSLSEEIPASTSSMTL